MKKTRKNQMLKGFLMALVFTFGVFVWCSDSVVTLAAGTAKVVANSGNIRENADSGSKVLASVKKDAMMDVIASKTDSDGYTWYKVWVNSEQTGYIRSDLVTVSGTISAETTNSTNNGGTQTVVGSNNSTETQSAETTTVNVSATDVATAKSTADVRVRKGAGTNFDVAGQAKKGTEVTVTGVAADGEGKNWYQVSFNESNQTVNGFIREDFLEVLSRVEPEVEKPVVEEPVIEEPVVETQDYYLKYMQNDQGEMDWFLFDNIQGTSQSLTKLLDVVEQVKNNELEEAKQLSNMRLIVIALVVVAGILIIVITVLIFKLRDAYEYEYEEDDEDETDDDDEEEVEDEEEYEEEYEEERVVRKPFFGFGKKKEVVEEEEDEEEETLEEVQPIQPSKPVKKETQAWQSKDFLELDDDMEFEFLDLGK